MAAAVDISWLAYFMPIVGFFFVFIVMYAILAKTKLLGESNFVNLFLSFIFATIFVTFSPGVDYVTTITPWFVILIISLLFVMMIIGFSQKEIDKMMKPGFSWFFIVVLGIIFLISAINVFHPILAPYLPGASDSGGEDTLLSLKHFVYSSRFLGAALLLIIGALASWIITKGKK